MIYRFLLLSDEVDKFHREICIDSESTFDDLRNCVLDSVGYTKDQMSSFFTCDENWDKGTEITQMEMDAGSEYDNWIMAETKLSDLVEDEGQRLLFVFDYMTERSFFLELKEIILGKSLKKAKCTESVGNPPSQNIDLDSFIGSSSSSLDMDEKFYGDESFDEDDLDSDGFDYDNQQEGSSSSEENLF